MNLLALLQMSTNDPMFWILVIIAASFVVIAIAMIAIAVFVSRAVKTVNRAEQKLEPARTKIEEMRLKEQAMVLAEEQFAAQLAEAHADLAALPAELKAFGNKSGLPAEIERLQGAIAGLGAVNLAALDELEIAKERKQYLDAQAADLTEAMATL